MKHQPNQFMHPDFDHFLFGALPQIAGHWRIANRTENPEDWYNATSWLKYELDSELDHGGSWAAWEDLDFLLQIAGIRYEMAFNTNAKDVKTVTLDDDGYPLPRQG